MTTYYLTKFPPSYRNRRWWRAESRDRAEKFLKKVREKYKIRGRIITMIETNKQTMKKTPKLHINIWKAKDGYRWHAKRNGRIVAESGEGYARIASLKKTLNHLMNAIALGDCEVFQVDVKSKA